MSKQTDIFLKRVTGKSRYGLCPEPTKAQEALDIMIDYLLGENCVLTTLSMSSSQTNTIAVNEILHRYSKKFRKEMQAAVKNTGMNKGICTKCGRFSYSASPLETLSDDQCAYPDCDGHLKEDDH